MKMHLNLATRDLDASVAFYQTLLGEAPAKTLPDYALFITENPGLELALDLDRGAVAAPGQHFGIVAESADEVEAQVERLTTAGYDVDIEREETCCYASQTKVVGERSGRPSWGNLRRPRRHGPTRRGRRNR